MNFLKNLLDFIYAPAGTFDSESGLFDACNDNINEHSTAALTINPATNLPMIDDAGIDVGGSPFGIDIHHSVDIFSANDCTFSGQDFVTLPEPCWNESQGYGGCETSFTLCETGCTNDF